MGVRALRARIECDRETLLALWRTHRVFNERLVSLIVKIFAMRRGEVGVCAAHRDLYQRAARFILARDSMDAPYLLNGVSIKDWAPATALKMRVSVRDGGVEREISGESWASEAAALSARGVLAYKKDEERDGLPDSVFQPLTRDAVAYISGHDGLVRNWEEAHTVWLTKRAEWEAKEEHKKYLELRPRFEGFEKGAGGKAGKRRGRWHLYLEWLRENPDLAAWRGGAAVVHPVGAEGRARIARAKPWKQRSVEAEEFWRINPELAALDKLHGYYERTFVRRRKEKKNPDGFDHRPTFTMPDPVLHPRWALFNGPRTAPKGYRNLKLPGGRGAVGSLEMCLVVGERGDGEWPCEWRAVRFRADPRLARFTERTEATTYGKGKKKGQAKTKLAYWFHDDQLGVRRPAEISGAKLILEDIRLNDDGSLKSATAYLVFACTIGDQPLTERARAIRWSETGEVSATGKKRRSKKVPEGLVSCAVDLGVRNLGFLTLATATGAGGVRVVRSRHQWIGEAGGGPDLAHIGAHKREIKRLRRLRGRPVKGEESHVGLQAHITHMGEDRFKKAARAIVNFALNVEGAKSKAGEVYPRADVLIVEKLAGFVPDAERERGINRALVAWNRGQLVTRLKEVAKDGGLKVFEVHPAGTSQCCCKCGALGRRYSIVRDDETRAPAIRFGWVEKLFACPNHGCPGRDPERPERPFTCNADHNASVNLHRRFVLDDVAMKAFFDWRARSDGDRERVLRDIERDLRPRLERMHGLGEAGLETPF